MLMVEFTDMRVNASEMRKSARRHRRRRVWLQLSARARSLLSPIADEDLERSDERRQDVRPCTSCASSSNPMPMSTHCAVKDGAPLAAGIDHENYQVEIRDVADDIRESLLGDLD